MTALVNVWALVRKEWRHYFASPIGYVSLAAWSLLFGFFYVVMFSQFVDFSAQAGPMDMGGGPRMSLNEMVIQNLLYNMGVVALFLAPMLTMRLFAEEKRSGTLELLGTSPLTPLQMVLGKFFGALSLYALMIASGLLNFILLWRYAPVNPEWRPVATGVLALLLLGSCFIAVGLFASTLTRNQIVSGTITFAILLVLWIVGWFAEATAGPLWQAFTYLGLLTHLEEMMKGVLDLKDVVFYVSLAVFGLFLAHQSLESQRWRA